MTYYKSKQIIFSKGKTKALLKKKYNINSSNISLDRNKKEINSKNFTTIKDNKSNYYELSEFKFIYNNEILKGKNIKEITNYKKNNSDEFNFTNGIFNLKEIFLLLKIQKFIYIKIYLVKSKHR